MSQSNGFAMSWKEIDSPEVITDNHFTGKPNIDRKFGDIVQFANNGYALGILAYKQDKEGFVQYAKTAGTSLGAMGGLKVLNLRERPDHSDKKSFPSGHVTGAFIPVGFLYYRYGAEYAILPAITGIAVAYSRVETKKHFITDTIAGATISILAGKFFTTPYLNNESLSVMPNVSKQYVGLDLQYRF